MTDYHKSYIGQIRNLTGKRKLIMTVARAVIKDKNGQILFIQRRDNNAWGMPGGSQELDDSILDTLKKETLEETGLEVISATPMAIYSDPRFSTITAYGDPYQLLIIQFLVKDWRGTLVRETKETIDAKFFPIDQPPIISNQYKEALDDILAYKGNIILK